MQANIEGQIMNFICDDKLGGSEVDMDCFLPPNVRQLINWTSHFNKRKKLPTCIWEFRPYWIVLQCLQESSEEGFSLWVFPLIFLCESSNKAKKNNRNCNNAAFMTAEKHRENSHTEIILLFLLHHT